MGWWGAWDHGERIWIIEKCGLILKVLDSKMEHGTVAIGVWFLLLLLLLFCWCVLFNMLTWIRCSAISKLFFTGLKLDWGVLF